MWQQLMHERHVSMFFARQLETFTPNPNPKLEPKPSNPWRQARTGFSAVTGSPPTWSSSPRPSWLTRTAWTSSTCAPLTNKMLLRVRLLAKQGQALSRSKFLSSSRGHVDVGSEHQSLGFAGHDAEPAHKRRPGLSHGLRRSLGSGPTWPTQGPDAVLNDVLANLVYAGLFVAVAAGNAGGTTGFDAPSPTLGLCVPASLPSQRSILPVDLPRARPPCRRYAAGLRDRALLLLVLNVSTAGRWVPDAHCFETRLPKQLICTPSLLQVRCFEPVQSAGGRCNCSLREHHRVHLPVCPEPGQCDGACCPWVLMHAAFPSNQPASGYECNQAHPARPVAAHQCRLHNADDSDAGEAPPPL